MEFPHFGSHCSLSECKQLDFLPIQCNKCNLLFCKDHSAGYQHGCLTVNETFETLESDSHTLYHCLFDGCSNRELTLIFCEGCKQQFCLKHRLSYDHSCISLQLKDAKAKLTSQEKVVKIVGRELSRDKPSGKVGRKSNKTSLKVIEMKLKMKATGEKNVPVVEIIYFNVHFTSTTMESMSKPMFFSKEFSVGKIIDLIAKQMKLQNDNHLIASSKLRLFDQHDHAVPVEMKMKEVLKDNSYDVSAYGDIFIRYI